MRCLRRPEAAGRRIQRFGDADFSCVGALLRRLAWVLLDEATSALGGESERLLQDVLARLMEGRTTIMIAHRLAMVQSCDRIVVMDHGRIVETGTHAELVRREGPYARLAALQFNFGVKPASTSIAERA